MSGLVQLNVGGILYTTTKQTLMYPGSFFVAMFSGKMQEGLLIEGRIFLDRNGDLFKHVLDYLRSPELWCPPGDEGIVAALIGEADYFCLSGMLEILTDLQPKQFAVIAYDQFRAGCKIFNGPSEVIKLHRKYYHSDGQSRRGVSNHRSHEFICRIREMVYPEYDQVDSEEFKNTKDSEGSGSDDSVIAFSPTLTDTYTFESTIKSKVRARIIQVMRQKQQLEEQHNERTITSSDVPVMEGSEETEGKDNESD